MQFQSTNVSGLLGQWLIEIPSYEPVGIGTRYQLPTQDMSKFAHWNWMNGDQDFQADVTVNLAVTPPDGFPPVEVLAGSGIINEDWAVDEPELHDGPTPDFTGPTSEYLNCVEPLMWFDRHELGSYSVAIDLGSRDFKEDGGGGFLTVAFTATVEADLRPAYFENYAIDVTDSEDNYYPGLSFWRQPQLVITCEISSIITANTTAYSIDPLDGEIIISGSSVQVGPDATAYEITAPGRWTHLMGEESGEPDETATDSPISAAPDTPGTAGPEVEPFRIGRFDGAGLMVNQFYFRPREYFGARGSI